MKIDFNRLILLLLPVRLRTVVLFSLLRVLMSPIVSLYVDLQAYMTNRRRRASATPQAMSIEAMVYAETGVSISISPNNDANSLSPDFYVSYPDDATPAEVTAAKYVIDRYKLAGKSYQVQGSVVPYSHSWSDYLCEIVAITTADSHSWSDYLCAVQEVGLTANYLTLTIDTSRKRAKVTASLPVASSVTLRIAFSYIDVVGDIEVREFVINAGTIGGVWVYINPNAYTIAETNLQSMSPISDSTFNYIFDDGSGNITV